MTTRNPKPGEQLTVRESAVCVLMIDGLTTKEIARKMQLSPRTVEIHRHRVMIKKGARNAADLVRLVLNEQFSKANRRTL